MKTCNLTTIEATVKSRIDEGVTPEHIAKELRVDVIRIEQIIKSYKRKLNVHEKRMHKEVKS